MSSERVDAVGYLAELTIDGRIFFYAMVSIDGSDDDVVYRRGTRLPIYSRLEDLRADLDVDLVRAEEGFFGGFDLDAAWVAVHALRDSDDFDAVITAWNELSDLLPAAQRPFNFTGELASRAYDKLFGGLNLPSLTPPGTSYVPHWTPGERRKIVQVIRAGVERTRDLIASGG